MQFLVYGTRILNILQQQQRRDLLCKNLSLPRPRVQHRSTGVQQCSPTSTWRSMLSIRKVDGSRPSRSQFEGIGFWNFWHPSFSPRHLLPTAEAATMPPREIKGPSLPLHLLKELGASGECLSTGRLRRLLIHLQTQGQDKTGGAGEARRQYPERTAARPRGHNRKPTERRPSEITMPSAPLRPAAPLRRAKMRRPEAGRKGQIQARRNRC